MPKDTVVQIFWDYENIRFPSNYDAAPALKRLRDLAHSYGVLARAAVYIETAFERGNRKTELRQVLQSTGWHIIDALHAGKKDVVDKMIMVDMCAFAFQQKSPVILLITADRDYAYACSTLRNHRCRIILITTASAAPVLRQTADEVFDWHRDVLHIPLVPTATAAPAAAAPTRKQPARAAVALAPVAEKEPVAGPSTATSRAKKGKGRKKAKASIPDVMTLSSEEEEVDDQSPTPKSKKALPAILDLTLSSTSSQRTGRPAATTTAVAPNDQHSFSVNAVSFGGHAPSPPPNEALVPDKTARPKPGKKRRRSSAGDDDDLVIVE
ncbi:NYN domain-domain containing protein [Rhodotorula toruloides]|uniref:NYN domain-domain containing protein n=1 Tax=Rhodotorula toruloides TaxID=5286 RepID=A0A2T0AD68_RHOTO|nr:NYN domain-domain containing protein [Rhodotorula toruloides]PRQ75948.1 NYN domain-domain containing protein [Rhodotorula toruloides]